MKHSHVTDVRCDDRPLRLEHRGAGWRRSSTTIERPRRALRSRPRHAPTYLIYVDKQRTADQARSSSLRPPGMAAHRRIQGTCLRGRSECRHRDMAGRSRGFSGPAAHATFGEPQGDRRRCRGDVRQQRHRQRLRCRRHPQLRRHRGPRRHVFDPGPAYVHGSDPAVAQLYIAANGADSEGRRLGRFTTYANPSPHAGLQRVVVSKLPDGEDSRAGVRECVEDRLQQELSALDEPDRVLQPGLRSDARTPNPGSSSLRDVRRAWRPI